MPRPILSYTCAIRQYATIADKNPGVTRGGIREVDGGLGEGGSRPCMTVVRGRDFVRIGNGNGNGKKFLKKFCDLC